MGKSKRLLFEPAYVPVEHAMPMDDYDLLIDLHIHG